MHNEIFITFAPIIINVMEGKFYKVINKTSGRQSILPEKTVHNILEMVEQAKNVEVLYECYVDGNLIIENDGNEHEPRANFIQLGNKGEE